MYINNLINMDINNKIDFKALVKSGTSVSIDFQSKIVEEMKKSFTTDEQKWYISNLYMYLNHHQTNEYPIDLENVYKIIGFANKGNAKKTLENNFIKDEDYKIALLSTHKRKNEGGFNKEQIMLNIDTFKNLCIIAKTDKGKEIRKYYVKLENIYNKLLKNELEENKLKLEEKDKINAKLLHDKVYEKYNILLREYGTIGNIIYIIKIKTISETNFIVKIGESRRGILNNIFI